MNDDNFFCQKRDTEKEGWTQEEHDKKIMCQVVSIIQDLFRHQHPNHRQK